MNTNILPSIALKKEAMPKFSLERDKIEKHLSDESSAFKGSAEKVFYPENAEQVATILQLANKQRARVTVSAEGTSITGARVPINGGWVLSMEKMRKVDEPEQTPEDFELITFRDTTFLLNKKTKKAIVPPGIRLNELAEALACYNLEYPPDPTEMSAMIAGTIATNASGARSYFYGPTRKWIEYLEIVFPTGDLASIRRNQYFAEKSKFNVSIANETKTFDIPSDYPHFDTKNAAGVFLTPGMDLIDLFIGSEGLLGVITKIEIKLVEKVKDLVVCVAFFNKLKDSLNFVSELRDIDTQHQPLSIEFFDKNALELMNKKFPAIPQGMAGAVLFEFSHSRASRFNPYPTKETIQPYKILMEKNRVACNWSVTGRDIPSIKHFRHSLPEAVNNFVRARVGKLGTDMAVVGKNFSKLIDAYEKASEIGVKTVYFGHIGDFHLHLNFLPENTIELEKAKRKYLELAELTVELGGTISAEHGVGKKSVLDENGKKIPYLQIMHGENGLKTIAGLKKMFDPNLILNIGNMVPSERLS